MTSSESTIRRCKNIRDRIYVRDDLPGPVFEREVRSLAFSDAIIADIGCGRDAKFLRSLSSSFAQAYGIDLEISENTSYENITLLRGDAEDIPLPDGSVHFVTMVNVVEHLRDPERVFRECKRVLKPEGSLLLTAPNKWHPPIAAGRLLPHWLKRSANRIITDTPPEDTFPAYYRANSAGVLRCLGVSLGFVPVSIRYLSNHPQYFMFSTLIYRCAVWFERLIMQREWFAWLRQQVFCHLQKPGDAAFDIVDSPR